MKILINTRDLAYKGGVVNFFKVLGINANPDIDYFIYSKVETRNKFFFLIFRYLEFYRLIKMYDIVHLNPSLTNTAILRDLIFLKIAKARKKKVVVFFHGWNEKLEAKVKNNILFRSIFKNNFNKVDAFFVSGTIFKKKLINIGISERKKYFLETMIADDRYIDDFSIEQRVKNYLNPENPINFLFISRITSNKGMNLAIDIFKTVQKRYPNQKMELIIAGDGDKLEETKQYVDKNQVKSIRFTGYIKDEGKHQVLKDCDITLFPTMYGEGIPNTVLEGMLYGMPIISRVNAGIPDWVIDGENGFITESTNPEDFVPFIEKLITNKALFERIARNNHEKAKIHFTKDVIVKRFMEHYEEVYNL